jgi:hypothetical protein
MKKLLLFGIVILFFQFCSCDDGTMYYITTDQSGFAQEFLKIPADGKIKITSVDALCSEVQKAGKFFRTHYLFSLRELTVILDCDCDNFKPTEYFNVQKDDKIKLVITHGEVTAKYKIKYEFIEGK